MNNVQASQAIATGVITIQNPGEEPKEYNLVFTPLPADQQPEAPAEQKE